MKNGSEQTKKVDALNKIAWEVYESEPERSLSLSQEAYQLATINFDQNKPYQKGVLYSLVTMAIAKYYVHADYQVGLQQGLQALNLAEEMADENAKDRAYFVLAFIHREIGNYLKSIEYILLRLKLCKKLNRHRSIASAKVSLGLLYAGLGRYEQALSSLTDSLTLFNELKINDGQVVALNNLSYVYMCMEAYEQSIQMALNALNMLPTEDPLPIRNLLLSKLGACYVAVDKLDEAEMYLHQAIQEVEPLSDRYIHIRAYQRYGEFLTKQQQWSLAVEYLQRALSLSTKIGQRQLQFECHELLGNCLKAQGKFEAALEHYEAFHQVKGSVFNERTQHQIQALEIEHRTETAVKEAEILRLKTISLEEMVEKRTQALAEQSFQLQQLLEREQHLAHELQLTLTREAELSQVRARIIDVVSHEFRTPLTIINTSTDLLKRRCSQDEDAKRDIYFERIHDAIFTLSDLLQDVTFISQADKDLLKPTYQTMPFQELGSSLERSLLPAVKNRLNVFISYSDIATPVATDPELIHQILLNLLSNAIQYSGEMDEIHINMSLSTDGLHFSVEDQGIGIPKDDLDSIFQLFQRGSNVGSRRGLGLGLCIVSRICDILDGQISTYNNEAMPGSTFKVRIPNQLKD